MSRSAVGAQDMLRDFARERGSTPPVPDAIIDFGLTPSPCDDCNLTREADHRTANHLALLAGHVRLKANELAGAPGPLDPANIQLLLSGVVAQIGAISRLHRSLTGTEGRNSSILGLIFAKSASPSRRVSQAKWFWPRT
jgi:hypothetical protein